MVHKSGVSNPMTAATMAQSMVRRLETMERMRSGAPLKSVRPRVARAVGLSPGTLENIRRGRTKDPRFSVIEKLRAALIRELEREKRAHEHELQILMQIGADPRGNEVTAVVEGIAQIDGELGE